MNSSEYGDSDTDTAEERNARTRPSALLFLSGLVALLVSVSALIGSSALESLGNVQFRWVFVVAAIVVGLALLLAPGRGGKKN
ncbi:hypothetical protein CH253_19625 [Rhodococcus sp. 06-156-3C]|uniref:hypothetical protein n=1 Tax=Nocardiaceae TaxID=85025 RepID=UPI000522FAB1|nr:MULTISPECIES: hypothetical protein [Rhodococcus]OZD07724.1 hypothetical protein CH280_25665 [Rhodococcus sp. 06-156-4C]OZD17063.1 hypothetical protein CH253_19625 [Rhodococcus sp. 06-156-3C]OZD18401.1 hypothetical protein CH248_16445 [Rhodococcus sp. 06-156-4a]OZD28398.1 hypothetical protein CH284_29220 [Rhodococcus sp. 06-156-3]OZD29833.1 hypothetical protein CH247_15630 [Rhodococcus sp. 06-156-3b]